MALGILSPVHVAFLLVIAVLLFGAKRLPELGSSLGSGLRDFKESLRTGRGRLRRLTIESSIPAPRPPPRRRAAVAAQAWVREARRSTCDVARAHVF